MAATIVVIDNQKNRPLEKSERWKGLLEARNSYLSRRGDPASMFDYVMLKHKDLGEPATGKIIDDASGFILSGSRYSLTKFEHKPRMQELFGPEIDLVRETCQPVLGICFGHQLIGLAHGSKVVPCKKKESGIQTLELKPGFHLVPPGTKSIVVEQHHEKEIEPGPGFNSEFSLHASSSTCAVQAIQHRKKPVYGVQFHPETRMRKDASKDGRMLLHCFFDVVLSGRR